MKRSSHYWIWLLADVSLDRAASILPLIGFPAVEHKVVQRCIDATGEQLMLGADNLKALGNIISMELLREFGEVGRSVVITWLQSFCFTDETSRPDLSYWDLRFNDLFAVEPAVAPNGIDKHLWAALLAAYRGIKPEPGNSWTDSFTRAANVMTANKTVNAMIVTARGMPLTRHDLDIYMRFGWNDYGTNQGLTSLEIGARLSAAKLFWQAIMNQVPAASLEQIAYHRDIEMWEAAANPADYWHYAQKYGVTPEQIAADIFPKPKLPPRLSSLLEN